MTHIVDRPPATVLNADGTLPGGWWHRDDGRIVCDLCPRACHLKPGDRGFCFVRQNVGGAMVLTTYGKSTGFCIDPIEKKPLNHFYPGTSVLSFGTAGCNLGCKFCQNWDISKSKEVERLSARAMPAAIAQAARDYGCKSVAFTYNDPVIWAEYAIDTAKACRALGIKTVAVTAGYITPQARPAFFEFMDAANVDLKAFTEEFYHKITYSHLQPVLETLEWLKAETDVWFEITNLVIPGHNDDPEEIRRLSGWILQHLGDEVPLHFSAFHPDFRMMDVPPTPHETLLRAYVAARHEGLKYVYVGNVNDELHQSTYCPHCGELVIERDWYALGRYHLDGDRCGHCGWAIAGRFDPQPGHWGRRRLPVDMSRYAGFGAVDTGRVPTVGPEPANAETFEAASRARGERAPGTTTTAEVTDEGRTEPEGFSTMHSTPEVASNVATSPALSADQRDRIRRVAAEFVASAVGGRPGHPGNPTLDDVAALPVIGAYVTLKRRGHLRGCCGFVGRPSRLLDALRVAALRTAREDERFPPVTPVELPYLDLSVNLLHGLKPVLARGRDRVAAVEVGRHGLRIQRGEAGGLLLPGVATDQGWDAESFLRHVCRKAGLPTTAWEDEDTLLWTFESIEFGGPFNPRAIEEADLDDPSPPVSAAELPRLAAHALENVNAMMRGLTPHYYVPGIPDGNIMGLALSLDWPGLRQPLHLCQLALRSGVPIQATLFQLAEAATKVLRGHGTLPRDLRAGVTVLSAPALHGTAAEPDLRGLDPAQRALLMIDGPNNAWVYDPNATPEGLLETVRAEVRPLNPMATGLFSLEVESTEPRILFSNVPRPVAEVGPGPRPPSQAGRFYPADAGELASLVDDLLSASARQPGRWSAAMVPHAGLIYSGEVAAAVFNRLEVPETVIVLGPKHTRHGVDWAVMPFEAWSIPGVTMRSDPKLARALAGAIPGLQLDAAAHQQEHAIEVELPFLARLAPEAKVVGIAIGGGSLDRCREFAEGLAKVVRALERPPLLLISSDMNHFADDDENRRLDAIALDAMARLDPAELVTTVNEHNISMCGVLPAVIVMETLRRLGGLSVCERVAYATSADVNGDTSRVVGYAGVLLN